MIFTIYKLSCPVTLDVIYIGQTNNLPRRLREHKRRFGFKPIAEPIETVSGDPSLAEIYWIEFYRAAGAPLVNIAEGGNRAGATGASTRARLSAIGKGRPKPPGFGARVSAAQKGVPKNVSDAGRLRIIETLELGRRNFWNSLTAEQRSAFAQHRSAGYWGALTEEQKSALSTARNLAAWSARTDEQRSAIGQKIAASRARNNSAERLFEIASANARAAYINNPARAAEVGTHIKGWWASMTVEQKADFVARRAAKKSAARAAKMAAAKAETAQ